MADNDSSKNAGQAVVGEQSPMPKASEASNEELRAANAELQLINEALQTVNNDLKVKLEEVWRAHSDLQSLVAATDIATLLLDTSLRIKHFTDRLTDLFSVTPADEGRLITDFDHQLEYGDLVKDVHAVLADLTPVRREVRSRDNHWYEVRLWPHRTVDNKIDGVAITFVNVSRRKQIEQSLQEGELKQHQQTTLIDLSCDPIFAWDFDGGILEWNRGSEELYGYSAAEAVGKSKQELLRTVVPGSSFDQLKAALLRDGHWAGELQQTAKDGRLITVESRFQLETVNGKRLVLESTRDVSERKTWEKRQQLMLREFAHREKNTLAVVQSIANQTMRNTRSREDFVARFSDRLTALSATHDLLVQSDWKGADLEAIARAQLKPLASGNPDRLHIEGQAVMLPADVATPFGLVVHELAANAAKYGALSVDKGTVDLHWDVSGGNKKRLLTVVWQERNGPRPKRGAKTGFGSTLIDHSIPNATVRREFAKDGFVCTIAVPLTQATADGAGGRR